jgi:1-acyl-sn-glycerol-3-phosphate acyltransferase
MQARLVNAWVWTAMVLFVVVGFVYVSIVWLCTAPFDPGRYAAGRAFRHIAMWLVWVNPYWHFRTSGFRPANPRLPYVVVSNHESYADIFLLSHLPWEMKWLSKDTIFRIPLMGWMMRMALDVPVRRGDATSGRDALELCRDRLTKKVSVMIFPEGTRSRGAELLPFKDGAFRLALEAGVPILPIAIAGTRRAMAKGTFQFRRATAECRVLEPIPTAGLTTADLGDLKARARQVIDEARRALQRELGIVRGAAEAEHAGSV